MDIEKCYEFSLLKEKVGKVAQQSKSLVVKRVVRIFH